MGGIKQTMLIITAILATFGIASLLTEYDGPFNAFVRLRGYVGGPFKCLVCLSCWVAIPICIYLGLNFIEYLAVIGGVIFIYRLDVL